MFLSRLLVAGFALALFAPAPSAQHVARSSSTASSAVSGDPGSDGTGAAEGKPKLVKLVISDDAAEDPRPENPLGPSQRNFRLRIEQIRAIAADPDVKGVLLDVQGIPGMAKTLDLLDELMALRQSGKPIFCYAETLGRNELLIATLADDLCMPPSGTIGLEGLLAESMYYKDLLARFDARVEVLHIGAFKTAFENYARNSMSEGQRATIQAILDEYWGQIMQTLGENRGLDRSVLDGLFADVLVTPEHAREMGLIDQVAYRDGFEEQIKARLGGEYELVEDYGDRTQEDIDKMLESPLALFAMLPKLLNPEKPEAPDRDYAAIVYASGAITSGKSASDWQGKVSSMGSETIVEALDTAREDEHCKAVVLRVNSPGGSALASDMIWRAVQRVKAVKPILSSMGSVAASGGYWISMGCTAIVAQPSTLTGSIGVVGMLPDLSATLSNNGIRVETVSAGPLGDDLSLLAHGPSERLKAALTDSMLQTYEDFLHKVAAGRGLDVERVRELAGGRVWTGRQALENGLVNELGSLSDSIVLACAMAGLDASETPLFELPEAPNPMDQLEQSLKGLTQVRSPLEQLLIETGFGDVVALVRAQLADLRPLSPDRVQAVLPFWFRIQ